jgi:hypothetical protein
MRKRRVLEAARMAGLAALVCVTAACQSGSGVRETLDARTGITWTTDRAPVVFARTEARYSRSARDYLYLGPVEVNRQGTRDYYLWVGVATTLDRGYLAPRLELPDKLYVELGGEVIEFVLQPWGSLAPMAGTAPAYATAVELHAELAARVTADQIARLAAELPPTIRVAIPSALTREYLRWGDEAVWQGFLASSGAGNRLSQSNASSSR